MIKHKFYENVKPVDETLKNNILVVEGVVGVGKTTLMESFAKEMRYVSYEEPVIGNPFLPLFYNDRPRYSFSLQMYFLKERFNLLKEAQRKDENSIMDRSIYADTIFANMLYESGDMTKEEYELYESFRDTMLEHVEVPKLMVYLRCSVDTAVSRIKHRNRDYEQKTERSYWENLNKAYEDYFGNYKKSNILIVEVDDVNIFNEYDKKELIELIKKYI